MSVSNKGSTREVAEFMESMPAAYARVFTLRDVEQHAGVVTRRGTQLAHAEAGHTSAGPLVVCVVADDRPGLLSLVTDALLVHGFSTSRAEVFCRRGSDGQLEAVDFFWLEPTRARDTTSEIEPAEVAQFAQTLRELITEEQLVSQRSSDRDTVPVPMEKPSRVYFELEALRRDEFVLLVETPEFQGLLFAVSSALHAEGVRIVASEVKTEQGIARDRFSVASLGGEKLSAERLYDLQQAVQNAISAARSHA